MNTDFFKTKAFRIIILLLAILIFALIVFWAGMAVGFRKALFSVRWGENYERNFIGPRPPIERGMNGEFLNAHGTVGEIVSINSPTFVVKGDDGVEKIILSATSTSIREFDKGLSLSDLKVSDRVTVVGEPNASGQIEAKIIRVFPPNI